MGVKQHTPVGNALVDRAFNDVYKYLNDLYTSTNVRGVKDENNKYYLEWKSAEGTITSIRDIFQLKGNIRPSAITTTTLTDGSYQMLHNTYTYANTGTNALGNISINYRVEEVRINVSTVFNGSATIRITDGATDYVSTNANILTETTINPYVFPVNKLLAADTAFQVIIGGTPTQGSFFVEIKAVLLI